MPVPGLGGIVHCSSSSQVGWYNSGRSWAGWYSSGRSQFPGWGGKRRQLAAPGAKDPPQPSPSTAVQTLYTTKLFTLFTLNFSPYQTRTPQPPPSTL